MQKPVCAPGHVSLRGSADKASLGLEKPMMVVEGPPAWSQGAIEQEK